MGFLKQSIFLFLSKQRQIVFFEKPNSTITSQSQKLNTKVEHNQMRVFAQMASSSVPSSTTDKHAFVAIIGTAGRKEDAAKMNASIYNQMIQCAHNMIRDTWNLSFDKVTLLSGGAAWSDAVAVRLYLDSKQQHQQQQQQTTNSTSSYAGLRLFLPAEYDHKTKAYLDTGSSDWRVNPGRVSNMYHMTFSKVIQAKSLSELEEAEKQGAVFLVGKGFHDRNKALAQEATHVIAFTWGESTSQPKDGGTKDTYDQCKSAKRIHVPLTQLQSGTYKTPVTVALANEKQQDIRSFFQ